MGLMLTIFGPRNEENATPRCEVAARDGVHDAIEGREHEEPVGHALALRRIDSRCVQHNVRTDGKNDNGGETREDGGRASKNLAP